ncbi:MAG: hypothetical protein Q4D38_06990 [Planctomycetia bacterium]|nr:hypothetical protein [Planctomycetia bacterium]
MKKKVWFFVGCLLLLIGLQVVCTDRVYLTSQFTYALAQRKDPAVERKQMWYKAIFGEPAKVPEKEVPIPEVAGYATLSFATIFLLHGIFSKK